MHLFLIILAALLAAGVIFRTPGLLRNFAIGFIGTIALLIVLALLFGQS